MVLRAAATFCSSSVFRLSAAGSKVTSAHRLRTDSATEEGEEGEGSSSMSKTPLWCAIWGLGTDTCVGNFTLVSKIL